MLGLLKWFFITLGVIFFGLILGGVYLVVVDPFELRPLVQVLWGGLSDQASSSAESSAPDTVDMSDTEAAAIDGEAAVPVAAAESVAEGEEVSTGTSEESFLSPAQQAALELVGIDPATLPTEITPAQEQCFIEAIGAARVEEIKAGAAPTPLEIFAGRVCL